MTPFRSISIKPLLASAWSRIKGFVHWHYRLLLRLLLAGALLFVVLALTWQFYLLPRLDQFRPMLEGRFAAATGSPIQLGRISGGWHGMRPGFHIDGLTVLNRDRTPALHLNALDADVAWRSIFVGEIIFRRLSLAAPALEVTRDASGLWHVGGFALTAGQGTSDNRFMNWVLNQDELDINGGTLNYTDLLTNAPPVQARDVQLHVRSLFGRHSFTIGATPPSSIGQSFTLGGVWYGSDVGKWATWSGHARIVAPQIALDSLWRYLPAGALPFAVQSGTAGGSVDFSFGQGQLTGADVDLVAQSLLAQYGSRSLELPRFDARLHWTEQGGKSAMRLDGRQIATRDGVVCNNCRFTWGKDKSGKQDISLSGLKLDHLAGLRSALPAALLERIPDGQLAGDVRNSSYAWQGDWDKPAHYKGSIDLANLAVQWPGVLPELGPANIQADFTEAGGKAQLVSSNFVFNYPQQFVEPIRLDLLNVATHWQRQANGWNISLDTVRLNNKDMNVSVAGKYFWPDSGLGQLDLDGDIKGLEASRAFAYLPRVVGDETLAWLKGSLKHGRAFDGKILVHGNLHDFPFPDDKAGQFRITASAQDTTLQFASDWPAITHINGTLDFHGKSMLIRAPQAQIHNAQLNNVEVSIPDLEHPHVLVDGKAQDSTTGFLDYIKATPLHGPMAAYIDGLKAEGKGDLTLKLDIPLANMAQTKVNGSYHFADNMLDFAGNVPPITATSGQLLFTESGLTVRDVSGQALGGTVQISGTSDKDGVVKLQLNGKSQLADVAHNFDLPLATRLHGMMGWQGQIAASHDRFDVTLTSPMSGTVIDLPAPVGKAANVSRSLRLRVAGDKTGYELDMTWEHLLQLVMRQPQGGALTGNLVLGSANAVMPARPGMLVSGGWPELNAQEWYELWDKEGRGSDRNAASQTVAQAAPPASSSSAGPAGVDLSFDRLSGWGRVLNDVHLKASYPGAQSWQGELASRELNGKFAWSGQGKGKLTARMSKVLLPLTTASGNQPTETSPIRSLPAIDLSIDDFRYKTLQLGKLDVQGEQQGDAWTLKSVSLDNPDGHFDMSGVWRQSNGKSRVSGKFSLGSDDFGKFLARIGYPDTLRRAPGKISGEAAWDGEPFPPDFQSMQGNINMDVQSGQFARIDPGAGRLLSILSLQSLTRRVQLDFRDVFSQGFEFDTIKGDAAIERGVARTENLVITGSAAQVLFRGAANFEAGTQDLRVRIVPVIGDSVAVATTIVNPIAGVAAFLLQRALKDPLGQLIAYEYDITGSMRDPQIRKVEDVSQLLPSIIQKHRTP
ncbi:YhdP family protein [Silvimonas soli]|uniref:YhdP family protein n=1 Tax=Silvimonas soli TaxID=2980100 RepID=UPI0024B3C2F3|nr:YhdP family protein [Silvimonas soli]